MSATYDYIIVGAGSAGCVLAARLTEDPGTRVLVLEFGGSDRSIFIQMPSALSIPMNGSKYNGGDEYRGGDGPLHVTAGNDMENPLYRAFVDAGAEAGYDRTDDPNGFLQERFGPMHMTIKNGVRWSTANAYLKPAMSRPNLEVVTRAMTRRVLIEQSRAVGVEYERGGKVETARCTREVIVASGPIGSPHLLQRSGIGAGTVLKAAGIEVLHDLPGVGENLQDHSEIYIQYACKQPITLNGRMDPLSKLRIGIEWMLFRRGLGVTNHFESGGFIRSDASVKWPDIQFNFLPAAMRYDGKQPLKGHGFMVLTGPNKPRSRGHVRVRSADPHEHPEILFNYLDREEHREGFRRCVRLTREIIAQPALDPFCGDEIAPGKDVQSDDEIDAFVRQTMESTYHPSGTSRMGEDAMAVVDSELRVRGVDGLRVVDSSVFPSEPNANLNAPTIMLAERAADMIRTRPLLPASTAPVGLADGWDERQRPRRALRPCVDQAAWPERDLNQSR